MERLKKLKESFKRLTSAILDCFVSHQPQFLFLLILFIILNFLSELLYPDLILDKASIFILLWLVSVFVFKLSGQFSIKIALVFLCLMPFLIILKAEEWAEKIGSLVYVLLLVGVIQEIIVYLKNGKK